MKQLNTANGDEAGTGGTTLLPSRQIREQYELKEISTSTQNESHRENAVTEEQTSSKQRSKLKLVMTMIGLYLSLFVFALDTTIIATATPTIAEDLHSASGYAWIGSAYVLAAATSAPIWAKLSDIWGRKLILLCATAGFFLSSILSALSQSMEMCIAGRALQGVSAGGLSQIVHITISDLVSIRERALFMASLEIVWAAATGIGPILGGVLSQHASWRWVFWINLPVCGAAFIVIWLFLDVHNPRTKFRDGIKAIDWAGSFSVVAMTLMVLLGLDFGGVVFPWTSAKVICLIVFGALTSGLFIISEKRWATYPLMPLPLFNNLHNIATFLTDAVIGFCFIGVLFFLPLYFQAVLGATQTRSGVLVLPCSIVASIVGMVVGWAVHRTGHYREFIWTGLTIITLGNGLFQLLDQYSSTAEIIGITMVPGLGAGLIFSPVVISIQANVALENTATATSTLFFFQLISTSISLVVGEVVFQNSMKHKVQILQNMGLPKRILDALSDGNAAAHVGIVRTITDPHQKALVQGALAASLKDMWILYCAVAGFGALMSVSLKHRVLSKEHVEVKTGLNKDE